MSGTISWKGPDPFDESPNHKPDLRHFIESVLEGIDYEDVVAVGSKAHLLGCYFAGSQEASLRSGVKPSGSLGRCSNVLLKRLPGACDIQFAWLSTTAKYAYQAGFEEMMDWLSSPRAFAPSRLSPLIEEG